MNTLEILAIVSIVIGGILTILGIIGFIASWDTGLSWFLLILGIILVIVGGILFWYERSRTKKPKKEESKTKTMTTAHANTNNVQQPVPVEETIESLKFKGDTAPLRPEVQEK